MSLRTRMERAARFGTVGAVVGLAACALGQPVRVLTFDTVRSSQCQSIDWTFLTGNAHSRVREHLQNQEHFGAQGIVQRELVWLAPVAELTPAALADADVVLYSSILPEL